MSGLIVIGFLLGFLVFREVLNYKERQVLTDKILSKDIYDYYNARADEKVRVLREERQESQDIAI